MQITQKVSLTIADLFFQLSNPLRIIALIASKDIDELIARLGKMENSNSMAAALADATLTDNSVDLILKAINDMQDKINKDFDDKLGSYVKMPAFDDLSNELKAVNRRVGYNENVIKDMKDVVEQNTERAGNNRKKLTRLQADVDALRGMTQSQPSLIEEPVEIAPTNNNNSGSDGASSESIEKL